MVKVSHKSATNNFCALMQSCSLRVFQCGFAIHAPISTTNSILSFAKFTSGRVDLLNFLNWGIPKPEEVCKVNTEKDSDEL